MDSSLFFELIRISIGRQERLSRPPTPEEWSQLFVEARRHTIVGVLYMGLGRLPMEQRPPRPLLMTWHATSEKIRQDSRKANHDAAWASECFLKAGFRTVLLKGQGNALLYPDPLLRQAGDVDLWLEGSRQRIISYVRRLFPKIPVQWIEMEFPVRKGCCIEVHTMPSYMSCPFDNRRLKRYFLQHAEEMFGHATQLPDAGRVCTPTTEVNLLFQLTHIYRHLFCEGIGLRQLVDYYYLMTHPEAAAHFATTCEMARQLHMTRFCAALMWVMKEVFGLREAELLCPADEQSGRFLLDEIMLAGNFGQHDKRNKPQTSHWGNFWQMTSRNLRFVRFFPREVLWNPWYRIAQFAWRKWKGYR